ARWRRARSVSTARQPGREGRNSAELRGRLSEPDPQAAIAGCHRVPEPVRAALDVRDRYAVLYYGSGSSSSRDPGNLEKSCTRPELRRGAGRELASHQPMADQSRTELPANEDSPRTVQQ